jgi:hypothetical protein
MVGSRCRCRCAYACSLETRPVDAASSRECIERLIGDGIPGGDSIRPEGPCAEIARSPSWGPSATSWLRCPKGHLGRREIEYVGNRYLKYTRPRTANLFDESAPHWCRAPVTAPQRERLMVKAQCAGCPSTATVQARRRDQSLPTIPAGWCAIWENEDGEPAIWCGQCQCEGRHERNDRSLSDRAAVKSAAR